MPDTSKILNDLTVKELEALKLLSRGYDNAKIAAMRNRQTSTISQDLHGVYGKLFDGTNLNAGNKRVSAAIIGLMATGQLSIEAVKELGQSRSEAE